MDQTGAPGESGGRGPGRRRVLGLAAATFGSWSLGAAPTRAAAGAGAGRAVPRLPAGGALDVQAENALPGSPDWRIRRRGPARAIEGFADRVSVRPGELLGVRVSTTSASYAVRAYRMGWYGGARARLVWQSAPLPGVLQPPAVLDLETRTARAAWRVTTRIDTSGWPEGCYLLRLDTQDGKAQRFVPVTVRSAFGAGRTVIMNSVATWQAYNRWGGADLYRGATGKNGSRSLRVTFDRPYENRHGAGQFLPYEAPLIALAESLGLPLAYTTGADVARCPVVLMGAAAMVSLGHDEYWSPEQRRHVTRARDSGTNLAVLGANCCYRRIRFEASDVGPDRVVVCYKGDYAKDPGFQRGSPPTHDFRRAPAADPESALLGVLYDGYPVDAPYVVSHPEHWLLAGTGARAGDSYPRLVGVEFDRVNPAHPMPRPVEILAHSPVVCKGRPSYADTAYLSLPSGAGIFATGTMRWVEALDVGAPGGAKPSHGLDARTGHFTRTVTANLLRAFAQGPAGRARPARDNLAAHYGAPT
ncbi:N,N-dimethylformamidase beta subunit family domain-containing protein [Streptomyces sp. NPDC048349]|uniref:N,N-dimethylformamidase beta subunit family domain-containing protein n=1 Tax=Streptomyces sp. NPDC048349 TaxID=3155486 RepID=UPI003432B6FF